MKWHVCMTHASDGGSPDEKYAVGIIIEDRRESTHDLIGRANQEWGTIPLTGERYEITPLIATRVARVKATGDKFTIEHI